eukprot:scaffold649_cov347-Pavlova_lutheri.AAC.4
MAKPTYGPNGDLVDGGADLSLGGTLEYLHDVLYITVFVHAATIVSDWFWLAYLIIPGYAGETGRGTGQPGGRQEKGQDGEESNAHKIPPRKEVTSLSSIHPLELFFRSEGTALFFASYSASIKATVHTPTARATPRRRA